MFDKQIKYSTSSGQGQGQARSQHAAVDHTDKPTQYFMQGSYRGPSPICPVFPRHIEHKTCIFVIQN